jgi:nuclease S1
LPSAVHSFRCFERKSCPASQARIERQEAILASHAPDTERLQALKYVVHFVADVHQPLHAGYADDRGGNKFQLQAYGRGTNLHALWDTKMIVNWPGGLPALQTAVEADAVNAGGTPNDWAEESCRIVTTGGFYPATHKLGPEYTQRWSGTVVQRLAVACARLAAMLSSGLSGL